MRWPPSTLVRIALAVAAFLIISLFGALIPISAAHIAGVEPHELVRAFGVYISLLAGIAVAIVVIS
jgi:hypothetical protein